MLLDQGLHLIRIAEAQLAGTTFLGLNATPVGLGKIEFFPAENVTDLTLRKAGDCIVARVSGDKAGLLVTEYKVGGGGEIKLRIDRVATDLPPQTSSAQQSPLPVQARIATPPAASPISVKLLGHISGRGDIIVSDNWLGDPNGASALEGFAIKVIGLPADVALTYSCRSSSAKQTQNGQDGAFIGSRGKSNKINYLKFELVGSGAGKFILSGAAYFSLAGHIDIMDGVVLHGKGNSDSLVAFVVNVSPGSSKQHLSKKPLKQPAKKPVGGVSKVAVKKPVSTPTKVIRRK
jgi:hypothetical protein